MTRFDVADQRSTDDLDSVALFGCRELVADEAMSETGGRRWSGSAPWGRHQWDRIAHGEQFDGMESWLPWLVEGEELLCDLLGDDALVVLVEPRRVRDRASELLDEESALADALADTWGLEAGGDAPRLHAPFDRLLTGTPAGGGVPGALGRGAGRPPGGEPGMGADPGRRGPAWPPRSATCPRPGTRSCCAPPPTEGPSGCRGCWPRRACWCRWLRPADDLGRSRGPGSWSASVDRGFVLPGQQGGGAGRVRRDRAEPPAPPGPDQGPAGRRVLRRPGARQLRGAPPARGGPLRRHGDPDHGGRHPRLPAARVPGRRPAVPAHRPDRAAHPLCRGGLAHGQPAGRARSGRRPGPRPGPPCTRSPRNWSPCTGGASRCPATPSVPTRRGRPSWSRRSRSSRPPTSCGPSRRSRPTWSGPCRWTGWSVATSGSARRKWPSGPCSRPSRTASRLPCWCRPPCWPASTPRPSPTGTRRSR